MASSFSSVASIFSTFFFAGVFFAGVFAFVVTCAAVFFFVSTFAVVVALLFVFLLRFRRLLNSNPSSSPSFFYYFKLVLNPTLSNLFHPLLFLLHQLLQPIPLPSVASLLVVLLCRPFIPRHSLKPAPLCYFLPPPFTPLSVSGCTSSVASVLLSKRAFRVNSYPCSPRQSPPLPRV